VPTRLSHALAFLLGFWLGLAVFLPLAAPPAFSSEPARPPDAREAPAAGEAAAAADLARLESDLFAAVNRFRAHHHKIALVRRADLDRVARAHSADMAARRYLSHESPEGLDWVGRLAAAGVAGFSMAGENVGMTTEVAPNERILDGWIHSPVHRKNLVAAPYNATGLGIARGADGALYYTQLYLNF
jgi:uncharacterized protein YkwD